MPITLARYPAAMRPLACAVLLAMSATSAWAATKTWNCASGDWRDTACWSPSSLPEIEDSARLLAFNGGNTQVRYSSLDGTQLFDHLRITGTSSATVSLTQSGGILAPQVSLTVGHLGTGRFMMSAGAAQTGRLTVGYGDNARGAVTLLRGTLAATEAYFGQGVGASGSMLQYGGSVSASDWLHLGSDAGGSGSYLMLGGSLSTDSLVVGQTGRGTMSQYGGKVNARTVDIGLATGANGSYMLGISGYLGSQRTTVGGHGTGTFNQIGGTHAIENSLSIGLGGTYRLQGGRVVAGLEGSLRNDGTLIQTAGSIEAGLLNSARYVLNGGTVTGRVNNSGEISLGGGTIVASLDMSNSGTVTGRGGISGARLQNTGSITAAGGDLSLNMADGIFNRGDLTVEGGARLVNASELRNSGLVQIRGGALTGAGQVDNVSGGIIDAQGELGGSTLNNQGIVNLRAGVSTVTARLDNQSGGIVALEDGAQASFTGAVNNQGTLTISLGASAEFTQAVSGAGAMAGDGQARFLAAFQPGNNPASVVVDVDSTFASTSLISMDLAGTTPGDCLSCHDKITFFKGVTLEGGTLQLDWYGGFQARSGDVFDLFDWHGGVTGSFADTVLPALGDDLYWDTTALYDTGEISIGSLSSLPTVSIMASSIAAAPVPEPESVALGMAGLLVAWGVVRRRGSGPSRG